MQEIHFVHRAGADVSAPGLEDRHLDGFDIIDPVIDIQGSERIAHHLRVVIGINEDTEAILKINDVKHLICNDQTVAGSESFRYPSGKIQSLLNEDFRIFAVFSGFLKLLHNIGTIFVGTVGHFLIKVVQVFRRIRRIPSECCKHLVFAECMCIGSLLGVGAALVIRFRTEFCAGRAVQPPVACGG